MKSLLRNSRPVLAVLWLVLPAVQYLGTLQRTALFTERDVTPGPLVGLDFTPWYILLLGATVAHFILNRFFVRSRSFKQAGEQACIEAPPSGG